MAGGTGLGVLLLRESGSCDAHTTLSEYLVMCNSTVTSFSNGHGE